MNKKNVILIIFFIVLIFVVSGIGFYFFSKKEKAVSSNQHQQITENQENQTKHPLCLSENEFADYPIDERYPKEIKEPKIPLVVYIRDKITNEEKFNFQIENIESQGPRPQLHKCGVYVIRKFNYDPQKTKQEPGYREELWRYNYDGIGKRILLLAEKDMSGVFRAEFTGGFQIDPIEKYVVLEKSYLGQDDYSLAIKDLNTLKNLFVLKLKDILEKHSDILPGNFGFGIWIENGQYLCGDIFNGALDTAYGCIKISNWETEIFPSPNDLLAGVERAVNYKKWYFAYTNIPTFTGLQEIYEQIIAQAKKEGKQKNLFVYNLRTKEKIEIASAPPEWRFNLKWLSDTELQYELPSGEKETYKITNR